MNISLAMLGMGGGEMVLVFAAILVLFGAKKIPEFAKGLGLGIKEFKKASRDVSDEFNTAMNDPHPPTGPSHSQLPSTSQPQSSAPPATVPKA